MVIPSLRKAFGAVSLHPEDGIAALLHEPAGGGGGTTDADGLDALKPGGLYLLRVLDEVAVGIDAQTLVEEHLAVGTLTATDEEDKVVLRGKLRDVGHTVGHITADGVEALEGGIWRDVRLDVVDDAVELVERLRGLGIEVDIAGEVELRHFIEALDDNSVGVCLSHEAEYLSMAFLAEDDDLLVGRLIILCLDALLELEHHRAGGIDDLDIVTTGQLVGLRGFTMGTEEHFHVVELLHLLVVDGDEPHLAEPFTLHAVVYDVTQTVEDVALGQFLLSFLDGGSHAEAEAAVIIDFDLKHQFIYDLQIYDLRFFEEGEVFVEEILGCDERGLLAGEDGAFCGRELRLDGWIIVEIQPQVLVDTLVHPVF